ncbi:hypothetical protein D3C87_1639880 [compost metagenome]
MASRVTGSTTVLLPRNSRRPGMKVSRKRMAIAGIRSSADRLRSQASTAMRMMTRILSAMGSSMRPRSEYWFHARAR